MNPLRPGRPRPVASISFASALTVASCIASFSLGALAQGAPSANAATSTGSSSSLPVQPPSSSASAATPTANPPAAAGAQPSSAPSTSANPTPQEAAPPDASPDASSAEPPPVNPEPLPPSKPRVHPQRPPGPPIFEPPLPTPYVYGEPPKPPAPHHVAPRQSFWLGARTGWLFPTGSLWQDGESVHGYCCAYYNRGFDDFARSGPFTELDLGARLGRHYNVFGLWEWSFLRKGDELGDEFGGQKSARSHFLGAAMRFSTDPDDLGLLVEIAVGWRRFSAEWNNGTEFTATDDFLNTRIGLGADIRLNRNWSLEPMITIGGGFFGSGEWRLADGSKEGAFSLLDQQAQHVPITLQVGVHYDAFGAY